MLHIGEKLNFVLNTLIDISEESQEKHKHHRAISELSWAKEFCTIRLSTSRQSGHTTAMMRTIKKRFQKSVIILPNQRLKEYVYHQKRTIQVLENVTLDIKIMSINSIEKQSMGMKNINAVFIDNSYFLNKAEIDRVYDLFIPAMIRDKPYFFVFMQ